MQQKYRTVTNNLSYWFVYNNRRCFLTAALLLMFSIVVYMFFTVTAISSSFAFDYINKEVKASESRIAQLEADRIARMKSVDIAFAKDRGFIEVAPTRYISKNSQSERFTLR